MKAYKYYPHKDNEIISSRVFTADSFFQKLTGLIFGSPLGDGEALLIKGCTGIHTMFMKYRIDALFIDRDGKVIAAFNDLSPWRFTPNIGRSKAVLELRSGQLKKKSVRTGDRIIFE